MDIDVWQLRARADDAACDPALPEAATPDGAGPRVRLEAGSGSWLLIADERARERYRVVLGDLRALLGDERVRFGRWSDSPEAGVAAGEWAAHGIRHALAFDPPPGPVEALIGVACLDELEGSAEARRALWQALRPLLQARGV